MRASKCNTGRPNNERGNFETEKNFRAKTRYAFDLSGVTAVFI